MSRFSFVRPLGLFLAVLIAAPAVLAANLSQAQLGDDTERTQHGKHSAHVKHMSAPEVKETIIIKAKPTHVWEAIQHERKAGDNRKLLSYDGSTATLHETFASLPVLGEASCDYIENESLPLARIDYSMTKSDRFNVFQGSWILSPSKDGNATILELSNAIDPGIRAPFWQDITKVAASEFVKRRLDAVCAYAEQLQKSENSLVR